MHQKFTYSYPNFYQVVLVGVAYESPKSYQFETMKIFIDSKGIEWL
jgi:hypothetical protein